MVMIMEARNRMRSAYEYAKEQVSSKGILVSSSMASASLPILGPLQTGMTYATHEISKNAHPEILAPVAIAALAIAAGTSIKREVTTLRKHDYCASPSATILNKMTKRPWFAATATHLSSLGSMSVANVAVLKTLEVVGVGGPTDLELIKEGSGATLAALSLWLTGMNTLILKGRDEQVINTGRRVIAKTKNVVRTIYTSKSSS